MKTSLKNLRNRVAGFTLIELLVVIAIIAILAGMLLPALNRVKVLVLKNRAKTEMTNIGNALSTYETTYSRLPLLEPTGTEDVTFGIGLANAISGSRVVPTNANIIAILMDETNFKNGNITSNVNHTLNPQRLPSLHPKSSSEPTSGAGVGMDGEYRDPWGNSYIISLDYSFNDRCRDAVYSRSAVTRNTSAAKAGYNGFYNPIAAGSDEYEFNGKYLIWSKGPDGNHTNGVPYDRGLNKDNVLGWTQ